MAKQDEYTRYTIRIPTPLYERVKSAAGEKSVNAQIIEDLEEKYPAPLDDADLSSQLAKFSDLINNQKTRSDADKVMAQANDWLSRNAGSHQLSFMWAKIEGMNSEIPVVVGPPQIAEPAPAPPQTKPKN